jgi:hypothetical protein
MATKTKKKSDKVIKIDDMPIFQRMEEAKADERLKSLMLWLAEIRGQIDCVHSELFPGNALGKSIGKQKASDVQDHLADAIDALRDAIDACADETTPPFIGQIMRGEL